jgi:transposase
MPSNEQPPLFPAAELDALAAEAAPTTVAPPSQGATPRVNKPERFQGEMHCESLDQRLDPDHTARLVWQFVQGLDLSCLYHQIQAVEGGAGRNATDPQVLFALWLYAAIDSVSSARELERLCFQHRAYEWLRGHVSVNYHMLADFRVQHGDLLKELQVESLAGLISEGIVSLNTCAQDGMRVRANAGTSSFRRQPALAEAQRQAREHLDQLERQSEADAAGQTQRQQQAHARAARERLERVDQAIRAAQHLAEQREKRKKGDGAGARASTTDPDARNMKMGDSGFRPAYNVQMATDADSGIILHLEVVNEGSDAGQMKPMMDQIQRDHGRTPEKVLTDGGFSTLDDIEATTAGGTIVYTPVKEEAKLKQAGKDPFTPKPKDSPTIAEWRQRMGTAAAKELYKLRAPTAELPNARLRNQGVYQMRVRGLAKVQAALLWHVLALNLLRAEALRAAARVSSAQIPCAEVG